MKLQRTICAAWAFTIGFGVLSNLHADETLFLRGSELTSRFEFETSDLRKSIRDGEYSFDLTVTNKSSQDCHGPLALVIEKTGVETLLPKAFDHEFADDGQGFLNLLKDNQKLKAGETLKLRRLKLKSSEQSSTDPTEKFSLEARVYEVKNATGAVAEQDQPAQNTPPAQAFPGGIPFRLPAPNSVAGQGNTEPGPVPDPIGDTGEQPLAETGVTPLEEEGQQQKKNQQRRLPTEEELKAALEARNAWNDKLFEIEGVHSVGRIWGKDGNAVICVKVQQFNQKKNIPSQLDGVPVEVYVAPMTKMLDRRGQIGYWRQLGLCEDGDPKEYYDRPIKIGVSGWNAADLICATGTIGCRLENPNIPSEKYMLSNSHVFADRGLGSAAVDDPIIQPGYLDFNCAFPPMGVVGLLSAWSTYNLTGNNTVDAAVATTNPLLVGTSTPCNGYGVPRETTAVATIGMEVMKYGRTTSFTTGSVIGDNVTSLIFDGTNLVTFVNQVEIIADPTFAGFGGPGDSGSLIVSRTGLNPVALLFAGSSFSTLGNHIDAVLAAMGNLQVDGQP